MKRLTGHRKFLTILGFTLIFSLVLPIITIRATDFEVGTQFGISRLVPTGEDDSSGSLTYTRLPSGAFVDIGPSPTTLYATWFPSKQFAIGPEFSLGRLSITEEFFGEEETTSVSSLYLGGRIAYFLQSHAVSNLYLLGRVSIIIFSGDDSLFLDEDQTMTSFGGGLGYQWRIRSAFILRIEGQYQRVSIEDEEDHANHFSFIIGFGTRFGNNNN